MSQSRGFGVQCVVRTLPLLYIKNKYLQRVNHRLPNIKLLLSLLQIEINKSFPSDGFKNLINFYQLTIGSYVSVRSSRHEARGKFGEHERCVRVARSVAVSNSSFLSALQTSQVNQLSYNIFNPMENLFSRGICLLTS